MKEPCGAEPEVRVPAPLSDCDGPGEDAGSREEAAPRAPARAAAAVAAAAAAGGAPMGVRGLPALGAGVVLRDGAPIGPEWGRTLGVGRESTRAAPHSPQSSEDAARSPPEPRRWPGGGWSG